MSGLFECCAVVRFRASDDQALMHSYCPPETPAFPKEALQFCFPDAADLGDNTAALECDADAETYTFVLTMDDGTRKYGFCSRTVRQVPQRDHASALLAGAGDNVAAVRG